MITCFLSKTNSLQFSVQNKLPAFHLLYSISLSAVADSRTLGLNFAMSDRQRFSHHAMCFRVNGIFSIWRKYFVRGRVLFTLSPNKYKCTFDSFGIESGDDCGRGDNRR